MSETNEKSIIFVDGMNVSAKEFDNGGMIIKVGMNCERLIDFLYKQKENGEWCNVDIKKSKEGKWYACLNTYKKEG